MVVFALIACSGGSDGTPDATTPTGSTSPTGDSTAGGSDATTTSLPTTIPLGCQAPPGFPEAGCCGDGVTCACNLQVMCDLGACDPDVDTFLADHPSNPHSCLLTGLGPSYVATSNGSPSYHFRCQDPSGAPEEVVQRWYPSMAAETWVFGDAGLQSLDFGAESGTFCDGTSPDLAFGAYRAPVACCEVRDPAIVEGCRLPACE